MVKKINFYINGKKGRMNEWTTIDLLEMIFVDPTSQEINDLENVIDADDR